MSKYVHIASFVSLLNLGAPVASTTSSSPSSSANPLDIVDLLLPFSNNTSDLQFLKPIVKSLFNQLINTVHPPSDLMSIDYYQDDVFDEKIFVTSSANASTMISFYGLLFSLLWGLAIAIVTSMVVCYWVGCEYEDMDTATMTYRMLNSAM